MGDTKRSNGRTMGRSRMGLWWGVWLVLALWALTSAVWAQTSADRATTLITHYYVSILERTSEPEGLAYWQGLVAERHAQGIDIKPVFRQMADFFFNSPEYLARNTTGRQFITNLYLTFFQRAPDEGGYAYWLEQLAQGISRNQAMSGFLHSPEFTAFVEQVLVEAGHRFTVTLNNVIGGNPNLSGTRRITVQDASGEPIGTFVSHGGDSIITVLLPGGGTYHLNAFYKHDDGLEIWEYWGSQQFTVPGGAGVFPQPNGDYTAVLIRNMPWINAVSLIEPSSGHVAPGNQLRLRVRVKNGADVRRRVQVEVQLPVGPAATSNWVEIPAGAEAWVELTLPAVEGLGELRLDYQLRTEVPLFDTTVSTDHGFVEAFVRVERPWFDDADYVLASYLGSDGARWDIAVDTRNENVISSGLAQEQPFAAYTNLRFYRNGTRVETPPSAEVANAQQALMRSVEISPFGYLLPVEYDTHRNIWRPECGFWLMSVSCRTTLRLFNENARQAIYQDLIMDALLSYQAPYLLDDAYVHTAAGELVVVSAPPVGLARAIDNLHKEFAPLHSIISATDYLRKLDELTQHPEVRLDTIETGLEGFESALDLFRIFMMVSADTLDAFEYTGLSEYLTNVGLAQQRLKTLRGAVAYYQRTMPLSPIDPALLAALDAIEVQLEEDSTSFLNDFVERFVSNVLDTRYLEFGVGEITGWMRTAAVSGKVKSKLVANMLGKLSKTSGVSTNTLISYGVVVAGAIDGVMTAFATFMEQTGTWEQVFLSANLSRLYGNAAARSRTS